MPVYSWKARTRQGAVKKGVMDAVTDEAVMVQLRAQNLLPIAVKPAAKDLLDFLPAMGSAVTTRELVVFTRQFSTMIDAGLPLVQCLDILSDQEPNKRFKLPGTDRNSFDYVISAATTHLDIVFLYLFESFIAQHRTDSCFGIRDVLADEFAR